MGHEQRERQDVPGCALPPAMVPGVRAAQHRQEQLDDPNDRERTGTMRTGLTSGFADDQHRAERFCTQVPGLTVKTSAPTARAGSKESGPRSCRRPKHAAGPATPSAGQSQGGPR
jgi:hypothetical protein